MNKLNILLKQIKKLFHTHDLELLWNINNKSTLYSTINRYLKRGYLIQIHRGFYSTVPLEKIDPLELGASAFHSYCYLSCETVLVQAGIIFQKTYTYTYCSAKNKILQIRESVYKSRQLKDEYLYNPAGIIDLSNYKIASPERAIADMLYFNPRYHFDAQDLIDWQKVANIQKEVGFK